ncbi:Imm1 family immunity protein [Streptomyces sp. NPDC046909]|uniref:Imm1 family immunity protein n=1 Tax=Streptomyces sp. NPDC046909 TaxID=3155617 RepID=UPI0033F81B1A
MKVRAEVRYRLEHGEEPDLLSTPEDVDALIDSLLVGSPFENLAQIHSTERDLLPAFGDPDHELMVGVNKVLQVGVLSFMDGNGNVATRGSSNGRESPVYYIQGQMTEFPACSEIPIDVVRRAVKEFLFSGGQRPTCVEWQELDTW